ncbi:MAG TPA: DUF6471 domain-containing protein [Caulobacteraceae bacterium]|jgi:hypothetical protein|nr:DUF6471 domain-containing protein [Caulobacteraceae bacterium]
MKNEWAGEVRALLRAEMTRRQISYKDLVGLLKKIGVEETAANLRNKISRGSFTAIFFVQVLRAIGCTSLRLDES